MFWIFQYFVFSLQHKSIALLGFLKVSKKVMETLFERRLLTLFLTVLNVGNSNSQIKDMQMQMPMRKAWVSNLSGLFAIASYGLKRQVFTEKIPRFLFLFIGGKKLEMFHCFFLFLRFHTNHTL